MPLYTVAINGTIQAQYYSFSNLGSTGVTINSGATIDSTYNLLNGTFSYPVVNSAVLLTLNLQIPGNALTNMVFDAGGSTATGVTALKTNAAAGNLTITTYSGSLSGATYTNAPTYTSIHLERTDQHLESDSTVHRAELTQSRADLYHG